MEILLSILSKSDGSVREVTRDLSEGLIVGRGAEEGILLEGGDLSREHLILTHDGTIVYVTDLSVNGTWLNGKQLIKSVKTRMHPEDSIEAPGYVLTFRLIDQPTQAPEAESPATSSIPPQAQPTNNAIVLQSDRPPLLGPVFKFLSSFTLTERILFLIAASSLLLLYTYAAS